METNETNTRQAEEETRAELYREIRAEITTLQLHRLKALTALFTPKIQPLE